MQGRRCYLELAFLLGASFLTSASSFVFSPRAKERPSRRGSVAVESSTATPPRFKPSTPTNRPLGDPAPPPSVQLVNGELLVNGVAVLTDVPDSVFVSPPAEALSANFGAGSVGAMLGVDFTTQSDWRKPKPSALQSSKTAAKDRHDVVLGHLKSNKILACARIKRWWMAPSWPLQAGEVPIETQFMLVALPASTLEPSSLDSAEKRAHQPKRAQYAVLLPLVSGSFRGTLYGTSGRLKSRVKAALFARKGTRESREGSGGGSGGDGGGLSSGLSKLDSLNDLLSLRLESGDRAVRTTEVRHALYVAAGSDPYQLLEDAFKEVAARLGTFHVRSDKPLPPLLRKFGWCTWDAFYSDVSPKGVLRGLQALKDGGLSPQFLILDDGWQSVGPPGSRDGPALNDPTTAADSADATTADAAIVEAAEAAAAAVEAAAAAPVAATVVGERKTATAGGLKEETPAKGNGPSSPPSASSSAMVEIVGGGASADDVNLSGTIITGEVAASLQGKSWLAAVTNLVGSFYSNYVEHEDPNKWTVKLWRVLVLRTPARKTLLNFFDTFTDFSKRLTSFKANAKFELGQPRPQSIRRQLEADGDHSVIDVEATNQFSGEAGDGGGDGAGDGAAAARRRGEAGGGGGLNFKEFIAKTKKDFGLDLVYCWHAMPGYWGGVSLDSAEIVDALQPFWHKPDPTPWLKEIEPSMLWDPSFLGGVGACRADKAYDMYRSMHSYLTESGVDGVKVDAQSGLGSLASNLGGGPAVVRQYTEALEASVVESFGAEHCVNCMCHSTENLYTYKHTNQARVSDDFYPKDEASQTWHVAAVACNSLFIGEIAHPDWDMFHSLHPVAAMHGAARAVGGCAVYTSDAPGKHDFALLRKLAFPDGSVPVCSRPGRPTLDSLFADPTRGGAAFKVFNLNELQQQPLTPQPFSPAGSPELGSPELGGRGGGTGVVAAFNLQGSAWDRKRRLYAFFEDMVEDIAEDLDGMANDLVEAQEEPYYVAPNTAATAQPPLPAEKRRPQSRRKRAAKTVIRPSDVVWSGVSGVSEGIEGRPAAEKFAAWSHVGKVLRVFDREDEGEEEQGFALELNPREFEIVTFAPVTTVPLLFPASQDYSDKEEAAIANREPKKTPTERGTAVLYSPPPPPPPPQASSSSSSPSSSSSASRTTSSSPPSPSSFVEWAPLGLANMMNSGGALVASAVDQQKQQPLRQKRVPSPPSSSLSYLTSLTSSSPTSSSDSSSSTSSSPPLPLPDTPSVATPPLLLPYQASVTCMGPGTFLAYSSQAPLQVTVEAVSDNDGRDAGRGENRTERKSSNGSDENSGSQVSAFAFDAASGALTVELGACGRHAIAVQWEMQNK